MQLHSENFSGHSNSYSNNPTYLIKTWGISDKKHWVPFNPAFPNSIGPTPGPRAKNPVQEDCMHNKKSTLT